MRVILAVWLMTFSLFFISCAESDNVSLIDDYSGYLAVTTVTTTPATGPGVVALFDNEGEFVTLLADNFASGTHYASGVTYLGNQVFAIFTEIAERFDRVNFLTGTSTSYSNSNITAASVRHITSDSDGSIYVAEGSINTIEKITSDNQRVGNPYIATTTGACVLSAPWGVAWDSGNNRLAVISSAASGRFSLYNSDGTCNTHVTAAPFNSGTPIAICYHATSNKFIVAFNTTHAIFSVDAVGLNPTQIYLNSSIINTPRAVACGSDGSIYVASDGTETIEKLTYSGTGAATRALAGPYIGPNVYTLHPQALAVVP